MQGAEIVYTGVAVTLTVPHRHRVSEAATSLVKNNLLWFDGTMEYDWMIELQEASFMRLAILIEAELP